MFSVALLLLLFTLSLFISDNVAGSINASEERHELQLSASAALDQLLLTPGNPANWDRLALTDANVASLGLVSERNLLDREKVEKFFALANGAPGDYVLLKRILALDLPASNFSLTIYNSSAYALYDTAVQPPAGASVHSVQRLALLGKGAVLVNLRIWVKK